MTTPTPQPSATAARLRTAMQGCASAFREFWQGYWDSPRGC
ncbi:MAG: hypothetical protein R2708_23300 [Vicinamibacterales bacterium]